MELPHCVALTCTQSNCKCHERILNYTVVRAGQGSKASSLFLRLAHERLASSQTMCSSVTLKIHWVCFDQNFRPKLSAVNSMRFKIIGIRLSLISLSVGMGFRHLFMSGLPQPACQNGLHAPVALPLVFIKENSRSHGIFCIGSVRNPALNQAINNSLVSLKKIVIFQSRPTS